MHVPELERDGPACMTGRGCGSGQQLGDFCWQIGATAQGRKPEPVEASGSYTVRRNYLSLFGFRATSG